MGRSLQNNMEREIIIKCKKAIPYLKEANKIDEEMNKIIEEWKKVDEQVGKMKMKSDKLKMKARPYVADEVKKASLSEFEVVSSFSLKGEEIGIKIIDMLELWKAEYLKKKTGEQINGNTDDNNSKK